MYWIIRYFCQETAPTTTDYMVSHPSGETSYKPNFPAKVFLTHAIRITRIRDWCSWMKSSMTWLMNRFRRMECLRTWRCWLPVPSWRQRPAPYSAPSSWCCGWTWLSHAAGNVHGWATDSAGGRWWPGPDPQPSQRPFWIPVQCSAGSENKMAEGIRWMLKLANDRVRWAALRQNSLQNITLS